MVKKIFSLVLALSLALSMIAVGNVLAAESKFVELDLSDKEIGSFVSRHGGNGNEAVVVEEDNTKSVVIAPGGTSYTVEDTEKKLLQYFTVTNSNGLSANTKGMVFESTLKITNKNAGLILVTNTSNVNPRIITLSGGVVRYNHTLGSSVTPTNVTYPENSWFKIKLRTNFTTGYTDVVVTDLATNAVSKTSFVAENWIKTTEEQLASFQTFAWYYDGAAGYAYTSDFSVKEETDVNVVMPSKILVEDDFDNYKDTLVNWSGAGNIAVTDRGKSAMIDCSVAETRIYQGVNLPSDVKGLVSEFSVKLSSTTGTEFIFAADTSLDWYSGGKRLIQFTSGGKIHAFNGGIDLGTYAADTWYDIKIENNFVNDYIKFTIFDGTTENVVEKVYSSTTYDNPSSTIKYLEFISNAATTKSIYIDDVNVRWLDEEGVKYLAPSNKLIRDNFDEYASALTGWSGLAATAETDRGKSAHILCDTAEKRMMKSITLPNDVKGLVSEFSVKLTDVGGTEFIYAVGQNNKDAWANPSARLIQFAANGTIHAFNNTLKVGSYAADRWYDVRIENNFVNDFTRISVFDGKNEIVKETVCDSTYYDNTADIVRVDFISNAAMATPKSIYIDDVNIFYITEDEVSGLKNPRNYSIHNEFENFEECENGEDLIADVTCDANSSFKAVPTEKFRVGIESVIASGRGKSFKATTLDNSEHKFYKDFSAVQNGVVEFDMMLENKSGVTLVETQMSGSQNENMANTWLFRFDANGNIKDRTNQEVLAQYVPGAWYHVVIKSGTLEFDNEGVKEEKGGVKLEIYNAGGLICEDTINMSTSEITRDSIRAISFTMVEGANSVFVDNVRAYQNSEQGIYPEIQALKRSKTATTEDKLSLAFSKAVDLEKSEVKVNGEKVNISGANILYIEKEIEAGKTYDIEYKVVDKDGYIASGFIGGVKALSPIEVKSFTKATMETPTATLTFSSNAQAPTRAFWLVVISMEGDKMADVAIDSQDVGVGEQTLTATAVVNEKTTEVKTFLWDKKTLAPIDIE